MSFTLEKHMRLYNDKEGVFIQIRPHPESPNDSIEISTTTEDSQQWYGKFHFSLSKEEAKLLAKALIEMSIN